MPTAQAQVRTARAGRYLAQLGKHGGQMAQLGFHRPRVHGGGGTDPGTPPVVRHTDFTETEGVIDFGWGCCTLRATDEALTLYAEAEDPQHLQRIQEGITRRLEKIGRRDHLAVTWQQLPPESV